MLSKNSQNSLQIIWIGGLRPVTVIKKDFEKGFFPWILQNFLRVHFQVTSSVTFTMHFLVKNYFCLSKIFLDFKKWHANSNYLSDFLKIDLVNTFQEKMMVKVTGLLLATQITWSYVLKDLAFKYQDEKE